MKNSSINITMIARLGMAAALSVVLIFFIHFPIFPPVAFLEYDPADIPIFICTFYLGPIPGLILAIIASVIQGLTVSASGGIVGIIMHILATGSYVLAAGFIYKKNGSFQRLAVSGGVGILVMTAAMTLWNLIITPYFMHVNMSEVVMLLPYIIAFNLIKATVNTVIAIILYKTLHRISHI